jgi:hypothetical protein
LFQQNGCPSISFSTAVLSQQRLLSQVVPIGICIPKYLQSACFLSIPELLLQVLLQGLPSCRLAKAQGSVQAAADSSQLMRRMTMYAPTESVCSSREHSMQSVLYHNAVQLRSGSWCHMI